MKVLVDTNIILDVLLNRKPHVAASAQILAYIEESKLEGFICATTVTTIHYLLECSLEKQAARQAIQRLLHLFEIAPVNRPVLQEAVLSKISDYEDAVIEQAALLVQADVIVTRNTKDFKKSNVKAMDPSELLSCLKEGEGGSRLIDFQ